MLTTEVLGNYFNISSEIIAIEYLLEQVSEKKNDLMEYMFSSTTNICSVHKNSVDALKEILNLVKFTQEHFTRRAHLQERWDVKPADWINESNKQKITDAVRQLHFLDEIAPTEKNVDAICVLGATFGVMKTRIAYVNTLLGDKYDVSSNLLILLAGERKVSIGIDGSAKELHGIAMEYELENVQDLREIHLMKKAYDISDLYGKLNTDIIHTPARTLQRATTETTILELLNHLKEYEFEGKKIHKIIFVSNQPYVKYQDAVINEVISRQKSDLNFEVVGPAAESDADMHNVVGSIGSYLWAQTPSIISKPKFKIIIDETNKILSQNVCETTTISQQFSEIKNGFLSLYMNNILMCEHINELFNVTSA